MATDDPEQIDTTNLFGVGRRGYAVVVLAFKQEITRSEALNLAAWLVALADEDDTFPAILDALRNT